jgi:hypothetical protein
MSLRYWYQRLKLKRACNRFDEILSKALESEQTALAQLSWVLSAKAHGRFFEDRRTRRFAGPLCLHSVGSTFRARPRQ